MQVKSGMRGLEYFSEVEFYIGAFGSFAFPEAAMEVVQHLGTGLVSTSRYFDLKEGAGQFDIVLIPHFCQKLESLGLIALVFDVITQLDKLRPPSIEAKVTDHDLLCKFTICLVLDQYSEDDADDHQEQHTPL